MPPVYESSEEFAKRLDERDPLARFRERFEIPPVLYVNGNSLGLMPKAARTRVIQELDDWSRLGVEGHFQAKTPWFSYHEIFRESGAALVGARPGEVVMMNGLTVNLHLMMASFYRPDAKRHKILIEDGAFPSDTYAMESQLAVHGFDPVEGLIRQRPRDGETTLRTEDVVATIEARGDEIALVLLPGVQYYTGQLLDMPAITAAAQARGCIAGWDLAHAAGNVPLALHDWNVDFAVWCSYKYLNAGPGAVGGCFVHERHGADAKLPRLAGWWGNDPATRFRMDAERTFVPRAGADGWQLSNPPILAMAPLAASLEIFSEAGMQSLRTKSLALTGYLEWLIRGDSFRNSRGVSEAVPSFELITPSDPAARGCQLSLRVLDEPKIVLRALEAAGVVADHRPPDVIRVAPVPLYNTFHEVWRLARVLAGAA
ncbi:MAG TPA: kynureninase [Candidatus Polarisedimenticolaceae bacterium]|nr:kynureninase [Candidatus Polarisedimenticolaceae bacterium]